MEIELIIKETPKILVLQVADSLMPSTTIFGSILKLLVHDVNLSCKSDELLCLGQELRLR